MPPNPVAALHKSSFWGSAPLHCLLIPDPDSRPPTPSHWCTATISVLHQTCYTKNNNLGAHLVESRPPRKTSLKILPQCYATFGHSNPNTSVEASPSPWLMCAQKPHGQVSPYPTAVRILPGTDFTEKAASAAVDSDTVCNSRPCRPSPPVPCLPPTTVWPAFRCPPHASAKAPGSVSSSRGATVGLVAGPPGPRAGFWMLCASSGGGVRRPSSARVGHRPSFLPRKVSDFFFFFNF